MNWERNFTRWLGSKISIVLHTLFFAAMFSLAFLGFQVDTVLLVLTTIVSLEAIYLSLFIQMTVNQNTESLETVEEDIEDIADEVTEISEDIDEMQQEELSQDENNPDQTKLQSIENVLRKLLEEVENLKKK